jgi:hypothetical protein
MVHGTDYVIQYEVFLTRDIDFYDDLLPIWINTRSKLEIKTKNKLIIIPRVNTEGNALFKLYTHQNMNYAHNVLSKREDEEYLKSQKFVMVKLYENIIRHDLSPLPEPITKEEYNILSSEIKKCRYNLYYYDIMSKEEYKGYSQKYAEINDKMRIQRIIHDREHFEEIKSLHRQMLEQVQLDEQQTELIQKVISHPKLEGIVSWHGLTLAEIDW